MGSWRTEQDDWIRIESVVDSGASAPVAPPSMAPGHPIRPSEGSKRGQKYTSASNHKLPNLGEQLLQAQSEEGEQMEVLFQKADVSRPLVSVSALCEMGNRVLFGSSGGVILNFTSGQATPFELEDGVYVFTMWIPPVSATPFGGQR